MAPYNYAGSFNWCVPSALFPTTENAYGLPGFTVVQIFADDSKYLNFISMGLVGAVLLVLPYGTTTLNGSPAVAVRMALAQKNVCDLYECIFSSLFIINSK